jgi:hypothetical protein
LEDFAESRVIWLAHGEWWDPFIGGGVLLVVGGFIESEFKIIAHLIAHVCCIAVEYGGGIAV